MGTDPIARPAVPPARSMLFVPGNRTALAPKGVAAGADALIFDLEDAVAEADKDAARQELSAFLGEDRDCPIPLFVRVNGMGTGRLLRDLEAIVSPRLQGVLVPKVEAVDEVAVVDRLLDWFEEEAGVTRGHTLITPILETAAGARLAFELASASARTAYMGGLGTRGGDVERSFGYRWSAEGSETFVVRSSVLMHVRAAGVPNPVTGMWADIADLDGLAAFARQNRDLGYEGMMCIHPTHVPVINEAFTPTEAELDRDRRLVESMVSAAAEGQGVTVFEGEMIDEAMALTAHHRLARYGQSETPGP